MGLNQHDLEFTVDPIFEIDSYKSKMGDDQDIVVLSFSVSCLLYTSDAADE